MMEKVTAVNHLGNTVIFNRIWSGHRFTDDELKELLNGNEITFQYTTKQGRQAFVTGKLADREYKGNKFHGFQPSTPIPTFWCGHMFTNDELEELKKGNKIHITNCTSKKGNYFECDVELIDNKIKPTFNNNKKVYTATTTSSTSNNNKKVCTATITSSTSNNNKVCTATTTSSNSLRNSVDIIKEELDE